MKAYIYKITCLINNKIYVGQTRKTILKRFERHCAEGRWKNIKRMPIVFAIKKYGKENFAIELLEEIENDQSTIDKREIHWGLYLNSLSPNGYNLRLGNGKRAVSEETRKKISLANKGRKATEETKLRLRISHLGQRMSEENRLKASLRLRGKRPHPNTALGASLKSAKTYYFLSPEGNLTKIYNMKNFCKENSLLTSCMSLVYSGKQKHHKGWKVLDNKTVKR